MVSGNIKTLLPRGRGDRNLCYLLLMAQRTARHQNRIRGFQESPVKWASRRIPAQSRLFLFSPFLSCLGGELAQSVLIAAEPQKP